MNQIDNAVRHSPAGAQIDLSLGAVDGRVGETSAVYSSPSSSRRIQSAAT